MAATRVTVTEARAVAVMNNPFAGRQARAVVQRALRQEAVPAGWAGPGRVLRLAHPVPDLVARFTAGWRTERSGWGADLEAVWRVGNI